MGVISRFLALAFLAASVAACSAVPVEDPDEAVGGLPSEAAGYVDAWFKRVIAGESDLGWSLIDPRTRELFIDEATYRGSITSDDWSGVKYAIGNVGLQDGEYHVQVEVTVDEGATLPSFFGRWLFIDGRPTEEGIAGQMTVRLGTLFEPSGIQFLGARG